MSSIQIIKFITLLSEKALYALKCLFYLFIVIFTISNLDIKNIQNPSLEILEVIAQYDYLILKAVIFVSVLEAIHNLIGFLKTNKINHT